MSPGSAQDAAPGSSGKARTSGPGKQPSRWPPSATSHLDFRKLSPKSVPMRGLQAERLGIRLCVWERLVAGSKQQRFCPSSARAGAGLGLLSPRHSPGKRSRSSFGYREPCRCCQFPSQLPEHSAGRPHPPTPRDEMGAGATRPAYGGTRLSPLPEPLAATCEARRLAGLGVDFWGHCVLSP